MKARAYILTIGASLALMTPSALAAGARNGLACDSRTKAAIGTVTKPHTSSFSRGSRALQYVVVGGGSAIAKPTRTTCVVKSTKHRATFAPNHYQVLRNALL